MSHVRFWADWPNLQPSKDFAFGDPANPDHYKLTGLDEQIRLANADGLRTIVLPYRYPKWVNGTENFVTVSVENFEYKPADRVALTTWRNWNERRADAARSSRSGDGSGCSNTSSPRTASERSRAGVVTLRRSSTATSPTAIATAERTTSRSSTSQTDSRSLSVRRVLPRATPTPRSGSRAAG